MKGLLTCCFLVAAAFLVGCDTTKSSDHQDEVVVESYLIAGEALPVVRLSLSTSINDIYSLSELGIRDANVTVALLGSSGAIETEFNFVHDEARPGIYVPSQNHTVLPERTYTLEATVPGQGLVTARTIVPGAFEIRRISAGTVQYQGPIQFEQDVTVSAYPGRQSVFVFSLEALDPKIVDLTPLYLDGIYEISSGEEFDPDSLDASELDDFFLNASPPINEGNYVENGDGTLTIGLPWFAIAFYGESRVFTSAIDDGIFDFMRYQQVQQGGSTLSPGEIPNVLDHIEGGRGVFGSMSRVSSVVNVVR